MKATTSSPGPGTGLMVSSFQNGEPSRRRLSSVTRQPSPRASAERISAIARGSVFSLCRKRQLRPITSAAA